MTTRDRAIEEDRNMVRITTIKVPGTRTVNGIKPLLKRKN
jgi:hypothetical protein